MKDLLIIREIEHKGIKVTVEINTVTKQASLVEATSQKGKFAPKDWLFAEREVGYLKTWLNIFEAMGKATEHAIEELEAVEAKESEEFTDLMIAAQDADKDGLLTAHEPIAARKGVL